MDTGGPSFQVTGWVAAIITLGAVCAALAAVVALVVRFRVGRPLRWVFRKLVGEPVTLFVATTVGGIVEAHVAPLRHELSPNDGSSMYDKVDKLVRSADETAADVAGIKAERAEQVPLFLEDHRKLAELHAYSHDNTHAINSAIAQLSVAMQFADGFIPALGTVGDELKATRAAIAAAQGNAETVIETARVAAEDVLNEARSHRGEA